MANSVTIAPSVGAAVLATQGGVWDIDGAGAGGDAIDLRRMIEGSSCLQEGVLASADWKVTATNGNMTVDVAANTGLAVVQGDDTTVQGRYTVAPHSAEAVLDITAADGTNPRLDMIVLQVEDHEMDGSGQNRARVRVIDGTATGGATLANRTGAATIPDTCLLLADILVPAAATEITTADVRDRRRFARGNAIQIAESPSTAFGTGGTGVLTAKRMECTGVPLRITVFVDWSTTVSTPSWQLKVIPRIDGTVISTGTDAAGVAHTPGSFGVFNTVASTPNDARTFEWHYTPTAGSHTFDLLAQTTANTGTVNAASLVVREVPAFAGN